eukprot:2519364-Pyramimonas_sp.AAC.1
MQALSQASLARSLTKLKAHQSFDDEFPPLEAFHRLGSHAADLAAKQGVFQHPAASPELQDLVGRE